MGQIPLAAGLYFFDPLQCAVARAPQTGRQYSWAGLKQNFPDQAAPFAAVEGEWPTVFRLPLRPRGSEFGAAVTTEQATELLQSFSVLAQEFLVFSKHVRKVVLATSEGQITNLEVAKLPTGGGATSPRGRDLLQSLPVTLGEVQALQRAPRHEESMVEVSSTLVNPHSRRGSMSAPTTARWVVCHSLSCDAATSELAQRRLERGVALLPHGAAALRLDPPTDYAGKVCCTFPLGSLVCGPPLLLHAHFALHSSRKQVPLEAKSRDGVWNRALLHGPLASALGRLATRCCALVSSGEITLDGYFALLELSGKETSAMAASAELRSELRDALMRQLLASDAFVFPVAASLASPSAEAPRPPLAATRFVCGPDFVARASTALLSSSVQDILVAAGLELVHVKPSLLEGVSKAAEALGKPPPRILTADSLCAFLRGRAQTPPAPLLPAALAAASVVRAMFKFVVGEQATAAATATSNAAAAAAAAARTRPPGSVLVAAAAAEPLDLGVLQGVPLLLLHSGQLIAFDSRGDDDCPVCLCPIALDSARLLPCGHSFHDECIATWLRGATNSCPSCRQPVGRAHGARATCFGAKCLWDWHDLLPCDPKVFFDKELQAILLASSSSRAAVEHAAAALGVRPFKPADLLPHRAALEGYLATVDTSAQSYWRRSFWALLWQQRDPGGTVFREWAAAFAEWKLVLVWLPAGGNEVEGVISLGELSNVFSLRDTDRSQQKTLRCSRLPNHPPSSTHHSPPSCARPQPRRALRLVPTPDPSSRSGSICSSPPFLRPAARLCAASASASCTTSTKPTATKWNCSPARCTTEPTGSVRSWARLRWTGSGCFRPTGAERCSTISQAGRTTRPVPRPRCARCLSSSAQTLPRGEPTSTHASRPTSRTCASGLTTGCAKHARRLPSRAASTRKLTSTRCGFRTCVSSRRHLTTRSSDRRTIFWECGP